MKTILTVIFLFSLTFISYSQNTDNKVAKTEDSDSLDESIKMYDRYCPILGGDTVRIYRGIRCTGMIKDVYPNGNAKHKGFYDDGKIVSMFTNYFENGQVERIFKAKSETRGTIDIYYKSGMIKAKGEYIKGEPLKWEDYYPDGKVEFSEEYNRGMDYHLFTKMYFENGNPQMIFELTDEKTRKYKYEEYYENGQIKLKGTKVQNKSTGDYREDGKWLYYDESGKVTMEETYERGFLMNDKKY